MNDVFIIALLLVIEDKKWRNIFYLEDIPPDWNPRTERASLDIPMIIIYMPNALVYRTALIGFFITAVAILNTHGLHLLQGAYPIAITFALLPV